MKINERNKELIKPKIKINEINNEIIIIIIIIIVNNKQ